MELGMIGLGRMGANMTERLVRGGHKVITYDRSAEAIQRVVDKGAVGARSLADFVKQLSLPRAIWLMVPSGDPVDQTIEQLLPSLTEGDIIIDGGNSNYKDSIRRAEKLKPHKLHFIDAGTSGGIWGLQNGYCMMVGGEKDNRRPLGTDLSHPGAEGWLSPRRSQRRRPLRQDDSQRHRVRHDAGLWRRLRDCSKRRSSISI